MADHKKVDKHLEGDPPVDDVDINIAVSSSEVCSVKSTKTQRMSSSSDRQVKYERAQKALENAALVSKRIKEHRKATAELLGRPFEEDDIGDTAEMASTVSERTGYSVATDTSTTLSVQDALNIPGISESLANTLKQKELLMERIKQYKEISKRPTKTTPTKRESIGESKLDTKKITDANDATRLMNAIKEKENALSVIQVKMKAMETTILDLQEKINEKDQIIEAKNMATTLISDSLSKKEKDSLVLLEDTRQQMTKMQENFINMEAEWKAEKQRLIKEIESKDEKISHLEEANTILENSRFEATVTNSKLLEELEIKNQEILQLQECIKKLSEQHSSEVIAKELEKDVEQDEKGSLEIANMVELTKKIEILEQINCQIRQTNIELENKLANINNEPKAGATSSPSKKASPLPGRKGGRNTAAKLKSPWSNMSSESLPQETDKKSNKNETKTEVVVQSLNKDLLEKEYIISQKDALIFELQTKNASNEAIIVDLKSKQKELNVDTVDTGVLTEPMQTTIPVEDTTIKSDESNPRELPALDVGELEKELKAAQQHIAALNEEIDLANKNMIKVKSAHKLKLKQMQKTIDNFSKLSDSNAEIVKLSEEMHQLSQKVAELEEEKGNLQLHLVDYDSGRLTESDVYKKMIEMENLAETRLKAISVLETQKFDLVQELHVLQQKNLEMEDKLADMMQHQNEQVCSEMKSVQLEEQIDELTAARKELELVIENLKLDKDHLNSTIKNLQDEKHEISHKLESFIQENIELTDKLDKLSTEKVSSAESIEIVESLTTQEKLELEEYNKGLLESKDNTAVSESGFKDIEVHNNEKKVENLVEQTVELTKRIELFNQERQEVMDKMSKISADNEILQDCISRLNDQCSTLQSDIDLLSNEKHNLEVLNNELNAQIEELKRERLEVMKETVEVAKPSVIEENIETIVETQQDDKIDKGVNRNKSVKQLTKEILKLKNTIKEREAEIGDCQMKILSLEEHQEKQNELIKANARYEEKINLLLEENQQLKDQLDSSNTSNDILFEQQLTELKQANERMKEDLKNTRQEYANTILVRDNRIQELEILLGEYEKQIFNYSNTLQQKDKEMVDYINQITKLNDVSQKLKSTIEVLEEEKAKDHNAELVKSLNKQISAYQKKLAEFEDKIKVLDDEKVQLISLKTSLENKNISLETELKKMQESFVEKQNMIKELQMQQQKHSGELAEVMLQAKEREEEIHEIKLQLRKESIENEKLRNALADKDKSKEEYSHLIEDTKNSMNELQAEKSKLSEQCTVLENKNKELMDKLKKFAINIKKKSSMYADLEKQLHNLQNEVESKDRHLEQLIIQVETLPALQEKLKLAEDEINRLQALKVAFEQKKSEEFTKLQQDAKLLEDELNIALGDLSKQNDALNIAHKELHLTREENIKLKSQLDQLQNKLVEHDIEQKNNINLLTKISSLEADINQKQSQIMDLVQKLETQEQLANQLQFGHDAKVQERELIIESLETEINKYKSRIYRLEESISAMEDRRHSLERKADQLDCQLQEKQKAYTDYSNQEDELVNRLAVLIDHDRIVDKQIHEIEDENRCLQDKVQLLVEENLNLRKCFGDLQDKYNALLKKSEKADFAESENVKLQTEIRELNAQLKRNLLEHQNIIGKKKRDIEELESEFNTQIESAIKEKKLLSEKYEKTTEHINQIESKLNEYRTENENLKINMSELQRLNQEILEKSAISQGPSPDYTEQYISEINNLNSVVNNKNQEIQDLNNKFNILQVNGVATVSNLESKVTDLTNKLHQSTTDVDQLIIEIGILKSENEQLQALVFQKEEQLKDLNDRKKVTFEMNIPKTEGLLISSTIEAINTVEPKSDISEIESQIVSDISSNYSDSKLEPESIQKMSAAVTAETKNMTEEIIVPKKAYLCYKEDEMGPEGIDPFNSDEGWGLGENEDLQSNVVPGLTHLNEQIHNLTKENEKLKNDFDANNVKMIKVMKKLKELKASNEILSSELKLSKQLSQSSMLDGAIEEELRSTVLELEKKIEDLESALQKEKREKESIKKQNEVFSNANEKLLDMKEKICSEVELWKYKFKEANDKMSTLQWGTETKESPVHKIAASNIDNLVESLNVDISKLEKENDELQAMVDQLSNQNKQLLSEEEKLRNEINTLNQQIQQQQTCEKCDELSIKIADLKAANVDLTNKNKLIEERIQELELLNEEANNISETLKLERQEVDKIYETHKEELTNKCKVLEEELKMVKLSETESKAYAEKLKYELVTLNEQNLISENQTHELLLLPEKYQNLKDYCSQLKSQLKDSSIKISELENINHELKQKIKDLEQPSNDPQNLKPSFSETNNIKATSFESENQELLNKIKEYELQIAGLNTKLQNLNTENDQLLSNLAELRSSMSTAVDQRGFEIAELWKQHLAQREADFLKIEQELRNDLIAAEAKYEQLLDSVQSSSQEETNKMIAMEQVSSLQNKIQDKEEHLRNLQDKYCGVMNELEVLRSEIEDEKVMYENKLLTQQEEYEKIMQDINNKNQEHIENYEKNFKHAQNELEMSKTSNDVLRQQVDDLTIKLKEVEVTILDLNNQLRQKDGEVYQKAHEYSITLAQRNEEFENVRKQLLEFEKKLEDLTYEKESELALLRLKMHDNSEYFERSLNELNTEKSNLTEAFNSKIIECTNLNKQIAELNKMLEEHSSKSNEMQTALENQELEIVTLKDEISTLEQMFRKTTSKIEKHVTFSSDTKPSPDGDTSDALINKELLDAVPRAELDLALYMLHQRDVRCEELTMELTQLLDERDTLQLRLSDSLRSNEELKSKIKTSELDISSDSQETISELPSFSSDKEQIVDIHRGQTSRSSSISDVDGDKPKLQAKLSELRSVKQSRDVRLRQQSEQRQMDMRLLQRDVANLPPEAVDQLAQAHHTLSRDSQSTSTVLLNWLRGKSTPKVVHM